MNKANLYFCKIQVRRYNHLTIASRNCAKLHMLQSTCCSISMGRNEARFPTDPCPTSLHLAAPTSAINPYLFLQLPLPHTPHHSNIPLSSLDPSHTVFLLPLCVPSIPVCNKPSPPRTRGMQEAPYDISGWELCVRSLPSQPRSLAAGRAEQKGCGLSQPCGSFSSFLSSTQSHVFPKFLGAPYI